MNDDVCKYHQEFMSMMAKTMSEQATLTERTNNAVSDVDSLFVYLRGLNDGQKDICLKLNSLEISTRQSGEQIAQLIAKFDTHLTGYALLVKEVDDFKWFRRIMNSFNDKLPRWFMTFLVVGLLFVLSMMFLKKEVVDLIKWW